MTSTSSSRKRTFPAGRQRASTTPLSPTPMRWMAAWPPLIYLQPESINQIGKVQRARSEGLEIYLTIDAGPNIKLLFIEENETAVSEAFPGIQFVQPFNR